MLSRIKGVESLVLPLLGLHMVVTVLSLFLLPQETWSGFIVLTQEGQYIVKDLALIAVALSVTASLFPAPHSNAIKVQALKTLS